MLDKNIVERMKACFQKAKELLHVEPAESHASSSGNVVVTEVHYNFEVTELALALFKEGYHGPWLDLVADINTLRDNKHGYIMAGNPDFMGLFGRDSIITSWQLLDYDPMIARQTLLQLAHLQGKISSWVVGEEPGKILHEYYPEDSTDVGWFQKHKSKIDWLSIGVPVYFSVDSTPLFVILYELYCGKTFDRFVQNKLRLNVDNAKLWIMNHGLIGGRGFVGYKAVEDGSQLTNQSWKDSSEYHIKSPVMPIEVQGYAYVALFHERLGDAFKKEFDKCFWMKDKQYYAFALDGDGKQVQDVTSNPGHLLFTGILDKNRGERVVTKLFSDELWTPYGVRTLSVMSENFDPFSYHSGSVWPFDNWVIAQGLKKIGQTTGYNMIKDALFKAYNELGYIPEYYGVVNNKIVRLPAQFPQAWSSGALLNFLMEEK